MQHSHSHHTLKNSPLVRSYNVKNVSDNPLRSAGSVPSLQRSNTHRSQPPVKDKNGHQSRFRVSAYYGYALAVFNIYGIPLSFGPYLEYYYNSRFPQAPFFSLTAIIACQVACIFSVSTLARWLYALNAFCSLFIPAIIVSVCFAICPRFDQSNHWWLVLLFRGFLMGTALGAIRGVSLLCLASHYRNNTPLASMQSGMAAMLGALCYTAIASSGLRDANYRVVEMANFGLASVTLLTASFLLRKSKLCHDLFATSAPHERTAHKPGTTAFHVGYLMVFPGLFLLPVFNVVLITNTPANLFPEHGPHILFPSFAAGMLSAAYTGSSLARRKLGALNMFVCAGCLAGCCTLSPVWAPYFFVVLGWSCAYGVVLGCVLTLHVKVFTVFHRSGVSFHADMVRNFEALSLVGGVCAGTGIFLTGLFVEVVGGFGLALAPWGVVMVVGAGLMGWGRWRRTGVVRVAI